MLNIWIPVTIALAVLVLLVVFFVILKTKKANEFRSKISSVGKYENNLLEIGDEKFLVVPVKAGTKDEFTVNSKYIIQVKSSSGSRLIEIPDSKYKRIIVVFPYAGRLKRYINENEMEFITYENLFWNMYVCRLGELSALKDFILGIRE